MKKERRIILKGWSRVEYFLDAILFNGLGLFLIGLGLYDEFVGDGVRSWSAILIVSSVIICLSAFTAYHQYRQLRFVLIPGEFEMEQVIQACDGCVKELDWRYMHKRKDHLVLNRPWNWTASWGERITIIPTSEGVLFNSNQKIDSLRPILFSFGWNKKNARTFEKNLKHLRSNCTKIKKTTPLRGL